MAGSGCRGEESDGGGPTRVQSPTWTPAKFPGYIAAYIATKSALSKESDVFLRGLRVRFRDICDVFPQDETFRDAGSCWLSAESDRRCLSTPHSPEIFAVYHAMGIRVACFMRHAPPGPAQHVLVNSTHVPHASPGHRIRKHLTYARYLIIEYVTLAP